MGGDHGPGSTVALDNGRTGRWLLGAPASRVGDPWATLCGRTTGAPPSRGDTDRGLPRRRLRRFGTPGLRTYSSIATGTWPGASSAALGARARPGLRRTLTRTGAWPAASAARTAGSDVSAAPAAELAVCASWRWACSCCGDTHGLSSAATAGEVTRASPPVAAMLVLITRQLPTVSTCHHPPTAASHERAHRS